MHMPEDNNKKENGTRSGKDRWIKRGFLVIVVILVAGIYMYQRRDLSIKGWSGDLDAALSEARSEKRRIVVLFVNSPPSETARRIRERILKPGNRKAVEKGGFIPVLVTQGSISSGGGKEYGISRFPTLLILGTDGSESARHEGNIGEQEFREFLKSAETDQ